MFPKINNKLLLDCTESDLQVLIGNSDYRENEYLDYKEDFSHISIPKEDKKEKDKKKSELKSDVCAFANSEGGFLVYGIADENGCAQQLTGIEIKNDNTDRFELDIRNILNSINPRSPYVRFSFIKLQNNRYVVVIFVKHDSFAPYTHIVDNSAFALYKRSGNQKTLMTYNEVKNMFNQSVSLEKEIVNYRNDRIRYYSSNRAFIFGDGEPGFFIFHIIPETFQDSSYNRNIFVLEKTEEFSSYSLFNSFCGTSLSVPCVDGIRCLSNSSAFKSHESIIFNNGIVECYAPLKEYAAFLSNYEAHCICHDLLWDKIESVIDAYSESFKNMNLVSGNRVVFCISVVGAENWIGETHEIPPVNIGRIDRDTLLCNPIICEDANDTEVLALSKKRLKLDFLISIGGKYGNEVNQLISEIYG